MDNKNEKTFADLFSSVAPESNAQDKTLENNSEEEIKMSEEEPVKETKPLTFDSLFDKVEKEDDFVKKQIEPETNINIFQDVLEQNSKEETIMKEEEEPIKESDESFAKTSGGFQDIFSKVSSEKESSIEPNLSTEESVKEEPLEESTFNPFLDEEISSKEEISTSNEEPVNPFFEKETEENTNSSETEPLLQDESPFFSETEQKETPSEQKNVFFDDNKSEEKSLDEKETQEPNLFFTNNPSIEETKNEEKEEQPSQQEETKNDFWEEPKFDKEQEEPKSVSPFFEENKEQQPENPLFLEKIDLIENTENSKKTSNISLENSKHFNVKIVKKKEPLIKFILGVISYALFIWLLLIGITLLVYVLDTKIRAAKGDYSSPTFNAYVVLTGSMLPEIQVYDVVVTKKVEASELEEGDVITFASADTRFLNTIITHRIIKKNYDAETKTYNFQTQGDNNNVADSALVPQSNIYGKVILKIPKLGYLQEFLASDGGWIIVILIPCLTVISYDIVKLAKGLKKKKYKNIKVQK